MQQNVLYMALFWNPEIYDYKVNVKQEFLVRILTKKIVNLKDFLSYFYNIKTFSYFLTL